MFLSFHARIKDGKGHRYCYGLIDPGSEWRLHRQWFEQSAIAFASGRTPARDNPGIGIALAGFLFVQEG
jgi:hypothetical protein